MVLVGNRIKETSWTTGTGTFTLLGRQLGFHSFASAFDLSEGTGGTGTDNSVEVYYLIETANESLDAWEIGIGTVLVEDGVTTLQRQEVLDSSGVEPTTGFVDFPYGLKIVGTTLPANVVNDLLAQFPTLF